MGSQHIMVKPIHRTVIYTTNREKNCQLTYSAAKFHYTVKLASVSQTS